MIVDWVWLLEDPDYRWMSREPGASDSEIAKLAEYFGRPLPDDYNAFLHICGGGELSYQDLWTIRLWRPRDIPSWSAAYSFTQRMAEAKVLGDNGGGESLVFDTRSTHADGDYPIFAVNFVSISWKEIMIIAKSFTDLILLRHPLLG